MWYNNTLTKTIENTYYSYIYLSDIHYTYNHTYIIKLKLELKLSRNYYYFLTLIVSCLCLVSFNASYVGRYICYIEMRQGCALSKLFKIQISFTN